MEFSHIPVLLEQAVDALAVKENGIYVDGTAGGGGHSSEILSRLTTGKLISIDQDPDAILTLTERFKKNENSIIFKGNFADMVSLLHSRGVGRVNGVLLDIGVSSHQLDTAERGFSFHEDAPLDMRMSQSGTTAAELVNTLPAGELRRILSVYGEEKFAGAIVNGIVKARAEKPIETTLELAEIIKENVPQHIATSSSVIKTFASSNSSFVTACGIQCETPPFWIPVSIISDVYCGSDKSAYACNTSSAIISSTDFQ